jgi:hypothetical protein
MLYSGDDYRQAWLAGLRTHYSEYGAMMAIDLNKLQHAELPRYADDEIVVIALKLKTGANVPPGVSVRMRINGEIFTAETTGLVYYQLLNNSDVVSVEVSKAVPIFSK